MNDAIRMQISAFVDGELPDAEADLLLRRMSQDADLRKQAAEFLEIGRAMRGEPGVPGVERLQERISAALNDKPLAADEVLPELPTGRSMRPLVGVAVAASVALLAIVGLQFSPGIDGTDDCGTRQRRSRACRGFDLCRSAPARGRPVAAVRHEPWRIGVRTRWQQHECPPRNPAAERRSAGRGRSGRRGS